jgi:hypothetical protein
VHKARIRSKMRPASRGLSVKRKEEWELVQSGVHFVLELGDRNIEKSRADLRRKAHQDSENKAVPRHWLEHKEAAKLGEVFGPRRDPRRSLVAEVWT